LNNNTYNLLMDRWILAERKNDDELVEIAPWEVSSQLENNPVVSLHFPMSDMEPILYEFLIGVFQTFLLPEDHREWSKIREDPPTPTELRNRFSSSAKAFQVLGDGDRFMQDFSEKIKKADSRPISRFPLGAPGKKTAKDNRDWIVKEDFIKNLCPYCAGFLLYGLQSRGPAGGRGYRTSVRGTSFITTLIQGENVWDTIWQNILPASQFPLDVTVPSSSSPERVFPWMGDLSSYLGNDNSGTQYTLEDGHPLGVYWAMPWRVLLDDTDSSMRCDVCERKKGVSVNAFRKRWYGLNYAEAWHHPLSPYIKDEKGAIRYKSVHSGLMYRNWKGLLYGDPEDNLRPALPIAYKLKRELVSDVPVWTYGHRLKRNRIKDWQETLFPLLELDEGYKETFLYHVKQMIDLADYARQQGIWALHRSLYGIYGEKGWQFPDKEHRTPAWNKGIYKRFSNEFWRDTEEVFFTQVKSLRDRLAVKESINNTKKEWLLKAQETTLQLYKHLSSQECERFSRPRMIAHRFLSYQTSHRADRVDNIYKTEDGEPISKLWENAEEAKN